MRIKSYHVLITKWCDFCYFLPCNLFYDQSINCDHQQKSWPVPLNNKSLWHVWMFNNKSPNSSSAQDLEIRSRLWSQLAKALPNHSIHNSTVNSATEVFCYATFEAHPNIGAMLNMHLVVVIVHVNTFVMAPNKVILVFHGFLIWVHLFFFFFFFWQTPQGYLGGPNWSRAWVGLDITRNQQNDG